MLGTVLGSTSSTAPAAQHTFLFSVMTLCSAIFVFTTMCLPKSCCLEFGAIAPLGAIQWIGCGPQSSPPFYPGDSLLCNLSSVVSLWLRPLPPLLIHPTHQWDGKVLVKAGQGHSRELSKPPITIWATSEDLWASLHGHWSG